MSVALDCGANLRFGALATIGDHLLKLVDDDRDRFLRFLRGALDAIEDVCEQRRARHSTWSAAERYRPFVVGGVVRRGWANLLAIATLLKPQIAAPFIGYYVLRNRWRPALLAVGIGAVASLVAIAWLTVNRVPWLDGWIGNTLLEWHGRGIDASGPVSFHMVDGRLVLAALGVRSPETPMLILGAISGALLYFWGRRLTRERDLLLLAALAVWTLLITYHRFYDAALLCVPLAWSIGTLTRDVRPTRLAIAVLACCVVYFLPGQVMLAKMAAWGMVSGALTRSWLWDAVALKHQAWALVILQVLLLLAVHRSLRAQTASA